MSKLIFMEAAQLTDMFANDPSLIEEYIIETYEVIEKVEPVIRSYITLRPLDEVLNEYMKLRERISKGLIGRLTGLLIAIKDNIVTRGIRTTCASKMLYDFIPPYNATVIEKILSEGGIVIGKTNMDEFAMGSTTETSSFFITRNPWNPEHVPGGSSGGSAAAVASYEATLSLGSDTGGSVRAPAAFTGIVGIKPTYGLVSRYGLIAYANSLEQIGPMARSVRDLALLLTVIAGHDPRDSTSLKVEGVNYLSYVRPEPMKKYRVAIVRECVEEGVEGPVKMAFNKGIGRLEEEGIEVSEISIPLIKYSLPAYYIIATAEASSNLARYDGVRYGYHKEVEDRLWEDVYSDVRSDAFGIEVKRRILLGTFVLSAGYYDQYYLKASKVRKLLHDSLANIFNYYDALAMPTMPILPPKIGERIDDPLKLYVMDINTVLANLTATPAISIPADIVYDLPVGLQLIGPKLGEGILINMAYIHEVKSGLKNLVPVWVKAHAGL